MDLISESLAILKINSISHTGNSKIVSYLSKLLNKVGLASTIQNNYYRGVKQQNLICRLHGVSSKEVLFNTHLDTVSPGDRKKWTSTQGNPFRPRIMGDRIYGLGSADVKLDYLCKLSALLDYKNKQFQNPFTLVGTYGEEMGLLGCRHFIDSGYIKPDYVFVGEPTNLKLVYAHKAMTIIRIELPIDKPYKAKASKSIEFMSESAHDSTRVLGKNAIIMAMQALAKLNNNQEIIDIKGGNSFNIVPEFAQLILTENAHTPNKNRLIHLVELLADIGKSFFNDQDSNYAPPHSVMNITTIHTEDTKIIIKIAFRLLPKRDFSPIYTRLKSSLNSLSGEVFIEKSLPALYANPNGFLIKKSLDILNELNIPTKLLTKPALTEASLYQQIAAQVVVFGPGMATNNIHKPNEHNLISQLHQAVSFYKKVIESFCLQEIP